MSSLSCGIAFPARLIIRLAAIALAGAYYLQLLGILHGRKEARSLHRRRHDRVRCIWLHVRQPNARHS